MSDQARLADPTPDELFETITRYPDLSDKLTIALGNYRRVQNERNEALATLREAERRAEEAESKLATATDTIRSLTALASEREAT